MSGPSARRQPKAWRYLTASAFALLLLIPIWTLVVMLLVQPQELMQEPTLSKQLMWWVVAPALAVAGFAGWRWQVVTQEAARIAPVGAAQSSAAAPAEQARREYVLEVIGLGVTLDKFRQGKLWDELKKGHPYGSIREQDPQKYPWSRTEKGGQFGGRVNDAMEAGAKSAPIYWGQPAFYAGATDNPEYPASSTNTPTVCGSPDTSGMGANLFVAAGWALSERPDRLLERAFAFFDEHPDVPYVVLSACDGLPARDDDLPRGAPPLVRDGYYVPEMPDSAALLLLARRERVDAVRPFAFEDADANKDMLADEANLKGFARRLFLTYLRTSKSVPRLKEFLKRAPTVPEWLQATHAFSQRDDIYPKGISLLADRLNPLTDGHRPPLNFKPTPWFPIPWNTYQIEAVDNMPTLGFLHRPVFVKTVDDQGKPLTRRDARAAALAAGWQQALQTLPEADRKAAPARVIAATGGASAPTGTEQTIALTRVLDGWAEQGGPQLDKAKPTQWIDTDARLGNTGAATWFMQMAIGVMGSYREGGTSAAINLRDPGEASIVLISPPSEAVRRDTQKNARAEAMLKFKPTPTIDPKNYEQK